MKSRRCARRAFALGCLLACCRVVLGEPIQDQADRLVPETGKWTEDSLRVGSLDRWFRVYRPRSRPASAPAVVLLHGGTQSMRKVLGPRAGGTRAWISLCDREGVVLIVPNGVNPQTGDTRGDDQNWNDLRRSKSEHKSTADDVAFIRQLLGQLVRTHDLDADRIYVTGASNGGMLTYRLLIETPELFAAAATFIAVLPAELGGIEPPRRPTPLLILNGTKDPLVLWEGGVIRGQTDQLMSVSRNREWWVQANRAEPRGEPEQALPDFAGDDGCRIITSLHPAQEGGAPVLFVRVEGGGHALPSRAHPLPDSGLIRRLIGPQCRDAEGVELAWEFMSRFRRARSESDLREGGAGRPVP
jgi:polyhydroxybutyrate depolymerase